MITAIVFFSKIYKYSKGAIQMNLKYLSERENTKSKRCQLSILVQT